MTAYYLPDDPGTAFLATEPLSLGSKGFLAALGLPFILVGGYITTQFVRGLRAWLGDDSRGSNG